MLFRDKSWTKAELIYAIFMALMWAIYPVLHDVVVLGSKLIGESLALWLISGGMIVLGLYSVSYWSRYFRLMDFALYLVICIVFYIELILYPRNTDVLEPLSAQFVILVVPYLFLGIAFDINKLEHVIYSISFVSVLVQAFYYFYFLRKMYSGEILSGDQITPAYQTLPHVLIVLWQLLKKPSVYNVPVFAMGMFIMISLGNRGSILSIIVFVVLYLFVIKRRYMKTKYKVLIAALIVLFGVFFNTIMDYIAEMTESIGMSMSFFEKMSDDITDSNGRYEIYDKVINYIADGPIFGRGLGADRILLGNYCHNFVLELMVSFGFFVGLTLSLIVLVFVFKTFITTKDINQRAFLVILLGPSLIKLTLSGSILIEPYFFLIVGYCISIQRNKQYI